MVKSDLKSCLYDVRSSPEVVIALSCLYKRKHTAEKLSLTDTSAGVMAPNHEPLPKPANDISWSRRFPGGDICHVI